MENYASPCCALLDYIFLAHMGIVALVLIYHMYVWYNTRYSLLICVEVMVTFVSVWCRGYLRRPLWIISWVRTPVLPFF
ncbi:hypothetical protein BD309DRAFT_625913 [Dichomitus squalens]|nr:hypothetical protein BD309DRAFT_625913 [Dichomitus squalens]